MPKSPNSQARQKEAQFAYKKAEARIEQARRDKATILNLSKLRLDRLPESIGQLTHLQHLDLQVNQLSPLPKSLLHKNPALNIPEDALGSSMYSSAKPPKEILDYYFSTRGAKGVALREMKLIVVGWGKAGKTTLVKRLSGERMDPTERETHGIMI